MADDASQPNEQRTAPIRRNSTSGGSGLPSHMDEQRKSVLANILKAIKGPEKSRRESFDTQNSRIPVSENSAFKQMQPSPSQTAPGPENRQFVRPNMTTAEGLRPETNSTAIQSNAEMSGTNARA